MYEIGLRADREERNRIAREEKARQEETQKQKRLARARAAFIESNRANVLNDQLTNWNTARGLETYLEEMSSAIERVEEPAERAAAEEWHAWAGDYASRIDPLRNRLAMPPDPNPTASDLAPFL